MEREEKNYKCSYSPTPAAQFSGLRRAGEVEFVIIARERGAITKGHSSPECYTKGKRSGHEATIMIFTLPGMHSSFPLSFPSISSSNYRWDEQPFLITLLISLLCRIDRNKNKKNRMSMGRVVIAKTSWTLPPPPNKAWMCIKRTTDHFVEPSLPLGPVSAPVTFIFLHRTIYIHSSAKDFIRSVVSLMFNVCLVFSCLLSYKC